MDHVLRVLRDTAALLATIVRTTVRSVRDNSGLAVVSVALAFGLWILVTDAENPTRTRLLPDNVPVTAVNVGPDVVVENDLVSVEVEVSVEEHVFESLTADDFRAEVNVEGLGVGQYDLPVEVEPETSRGGLRVEEVRPARIRVNLAALVSKDVPVVLDVIGAPPEGYEVSDPGTDDAAVRVSGPRSRVDLVTQAYAAIDVTARTDSLEQSIRLEPRDDNGNPVEGVTLEPGITNVSVEITQVVYSKAVVVEPVIEGVPAEGFTVVSVSVRPVSVIVSGDADFIAQVQTIRTEPVDVGGEDSEVVTSVDLDLSALPEGAGVTGSGNVTVTVGIEQRTEESTMLPAAVLARI
jgi:YbbR domain-containing protein